MQLPPLPHPPKAPSRSIFPTTRRVANLVLMACGITGAVFAALVWVANLRSDWDALKHEVGRLDLALSTQRADTETMRRALEKQIAQVQLENDALRAAVQKTVDAIELRKLGASVITGDAKKSLNRAERLRYGMPEN